jgi:hypothetical protein
MSRIRSLLVLVAVAALALPASALAAHSKVTGGSTQIALSQAASTAMSANHLTVAPLAPATASGSTLSFPISRGHLNLNNKHGVIRHQGGFSLSNGTRTVRLRHLILVSNKNGVSLFAFVRARAVGSCKHHPRHCVVFTVRRVARVTGASIQGASATATVRLTGFSARAINSLAGKQMVKVGTAIGKITITPTFG